MMGGEYPGLHMHLGLPEMDNTLAVTSMVPPLRIGPNGLPLLPGGGFVSGAVRRPQRRKAPRDAWTDAEDAKLRSVVDNHRTPKQVMPGEKQPSAQVRAVKEFHHTLPLLLSHAHMLSFLSPSFRRARPPGSTGLRSRR